MPIQSETAICTWFVADDAQSATFFPQVGTRSDVPATQAVYWKCIVCFFASSLALNHRARHVFFTNTDLPTIDGVDMARLFRSWSIEVVRMPITFRPPRGSVDRWGNQFYILDIIRHCAKSGDATRYLVLDSDCIWIRPVDEFESIIDRDGAITYLLDATEHPEAEAINGLSRAGMARCLASLGGRQAASIPYYGGEIFAANLQTIRKLDQYIDVLWQHVLDRAADAPKEEAHFLSILYALLDVPAAQGNRLIRRIWTTFRHNNASRSDLELWVWHLPSEKRTGFRNLFQLIAVRLAVEGNPPPALGIGIYQRLFGIPRRRPLKFVRDLVDKLAQKMKSRLQSPRS
jgi:hypothetical protein